MQIEITKGIDSDRIDITRPDGSQVSTTFPKKGWFPHDAVHLIVEKQLGFSAGFWGHIAKGHAPEEIADIAKQGGHPSASRPTAPHASIVQLLQAERIVECFEAEIWSEATEFETFIDVLCAACGHSQIAVPDLTEEDLKVIRNQISELSVKWRELSIGQKLDLKWS